MKSDKRVTKQIIIAALLTLLGSVLGLIPLYYSIRAFQEESHGESNYLATLQKAKVWSALVFILLFTITCALIALYLMNH